MPENHTANNYWCTCEKPEDTFPMRTDHYCQNFLPHSWLLQYRNFDQPDAEERYLYLFGTCIRCGGIARAGVSIAPDLTGDALLEEVYRQMCNYRPFNGHSKETGSYVGFMSGRCHWYQQQDDLTLEARNEQFLNLFFEMDHAAVRKWLKKHHAEEPFTKPRRDRKSNLFNAILERLKADDRWDKIQSILDYHLPSKSEPEWPDRDTYLTNYEFDIVPRMTFGGSEGIYISVLLDGFFDQSGKRETCIGTFKTLGTDLATCRLMGELCGLLMYYGSAYVNENIHRYTPERELQAEYRRKFPATSDEKGEV